MLYEQIIARVIEDSRERFAAEGSDVAVLNELQKVRRARAHTQRAARCRGARGDGARGDGARAQWRVPRAQWRG